MSEDVIWGVFFLRLLQQIRVFAPRMWRLNSSERFFVLFNLGLILSLSSSSSS